MATDALTQLVQRTRMWLAGISFGGRRDLYQLFGYQRNPQHLDYVARYLRQDIAKRVIDAPVLATWCDAPNISGGQVFDDAWQAISGPSAPVSIWQNLIRLDKLAGLGSYAGMVIGFDDGKTLDQPIKQQTNRKILYLQPYAEAAITVKLYEKDQNNARYGLPVLYTISPGRFSADTRLGTVSGQFSSEKGRAPFDVHFSRFLHVAENLLEDSVYGRSRMEVVINVLDDILKVAGGSAETYWMVANRGMQVDIDKEMDMDETAAADLSKEIEEYQHEIRRFIRTRGVKINALGADQTDPRGVFEVLLALVSAATGIPKLVLIGSSTGTLSSQQDRGNWSDRISERVTEYAEPVVLLQLFVLLINAGVLPQPDPKIFEIKWPEAFKLNPLERAQTSAQMARSAANLVKVMQGGQPATPEVPAQDAITDPESGKVTPAQPGQPAQDEIEPLFTRDEARQIVGFGKHMPVFDGTDPAPTPKTEGKGADNVSTATS